MTQRLRPFLFSRSDATYVRVCLGPQLYGDQADLVPVRHQFFEEHEL